MNYPGSYDTISFPPVPCMLRYICCAPHRTFFAIPIRGTGFPASFSHPLIPTPRVRSRFSLHSCHALRPKFPLPLQWMHVTLCPNTFVPRYSGNIACAREVHASVLSTLFPTVLNGHGISHHRKFLHQTGTHTVSGRVWSTWFTGHRFIPCQASAQSSGHFAIPKPRLVAW